MHKLSLLALVLFLVAGTISAQVVSGDRAASLVPGTAMLRYADDNPLPQYILLENGNLQTISEAPIWLDKHLDLPAGTSFEVLTDDLDRNGNRHVRLQQYADGYPVRGGQMILHGRDGYWDHATGELFMTGSTPQLLITGSQAIATVLDIIPSEQYAWENEPALSDYPAAELTWVPADLAFNKNAFQLAYAVKVYSLQPLAHNTIYLDVYTGTEIAREEHIHTRENGEAHPPHAGHAAERTTSVPGIAVTAYAGMRDIETTLIGADYVLHDFTRGDGVQTWNCETQSNYIFVNFTDDDNTWDNVNPQMDEVATDAHWGAEAYLDYLTFLGRNSIDNNGELIESHVHYGFQFANAFWDGSRMTYGDGAPGSILPLPLTSIDVVAHEITHGLTERTSNLIYNDESGALNESFSDIFGAILNFHTRPNEATWIIGADLTLDGAGIRNMMDPNIHNDPGTYDGDFWVDGADVHFNSGVQNHWFQLLVDGETGVNDVNFAYDLEPLSLDTAAMIAYQNVAFYLTPSSNYQDAGFNSVLAAGNLFGSCSEYINKVYDAWQAVNVIFGSPGIVSANFTLEQDIFCDVNETVNFINTSFADNYIWDLGDGTITTDENPSHVYGTAGSYTITLTAFGGSCNNDTVVNVFEDAVVIDPNSIYCTSFTMDVDQTVSECSGVVFDSGGPDGDYQNNEFVNFTILNPANGTITLDLVFFETEGGFDDMRIYDGADDSAPLIVSLDGIHTGETYESTGAAITLQFDSDGSVIRPGWEITWGNGQGAGPADATFTADNTNPLINQPVTFTPVSPDSPDLSYDFGDGSPVEQGLGPITHGFEASGTYTVTAIDNNCTEQDTFTLEVVVQEGTTYTIDPLMICDSLFVGETAQHTITITNTGDTDGYLGFELPSFVPVTEVSTIPFTTNGAITNHSFTDVPSSVNEILLTFTAQGDFDNADEGATIYLEGEELGMVGGTFMPGELYVLEVLIDGPTLLSALADGVLDFSAENTDAVDVFGTASHTFQLDYAPAEFFNLDDLPADDILTAGQSVTITVNLDATDINPGYYENFLQILTSDVNNATYDFPIKLRVFGTPIAEYSTTFLNFGQVFTNQATFRNFTITNVGTDTLLVTSLNSTNPLFNTATQPFALAAGQDSVIRVDFLGTPTADLYSGRIEVMTNAGNQNINYLIEVVEAPVASVSPDSICVTLNAGENLDTSLFITNTGLSALSYQVAAGYGDTSTMVYTGGNAFTDHVFDDYPEVSEAQLQIIIQGDFDLANEFVSVIINGQDFGELPDNGQDNQPDTLYFDVPSDLLASGTLNVRIQNSGAVDDLFGYANLHDVRLLVETPEWLVFDGNSTQLSPGAQFNFPVNIDATNLNGGTYNSILFFTSNDPQLDSKAIPVKLIVIGTPALVTNVDTLDFGGVQLTTSRILTLRVHNPGTDFLVIESTTIASGQYAADQFNFTVAPGGFQDVNVIFAPSIIGPLNSELVLSGPTHTLTVPLIGTGLPVPEASLSTDTICVDLLMGEDSIVNVVLENLGQGELDYDLGLGGIGNRVLVWATVGVDDVSLDNMLTVLDDPANLLDVTVTSSVIAAEMTELLSTTDVLVIPNYITFIDFNTINEIGAVMNTWLNAGGRLIAVGNGDFGIPTDLDVISGFFQGDVLNDADIQIDDNAHPLLDDVQLPLGLEGGLSNVTGLAGNADVTMVASQSGSAANIGIIFTEDREEGEAVFIGYNYTELTEQNEQILVNAIEYTRTELPLPEWLTVDNTNGTIDPGGQTDINLTFMSGDLPGGEYTFPLSYTFNQPTNGTGLIYLKMTLRTAPNPAFSSLNEISCDGTVTFMDESTQDPTSWEWDFGDGFGSTEQNPTHNYSATGTFDVTLTVCNELGCNTLTREDFILVDLQNPFCQQTTFEDNETIELAGCGGTIYSTGFPGNYPNGVNAGILINSGNGGPIRLTTVSFSLENNFDFLRVYDGADETADLLGVFTNLDLVPGDIVESTGGQMFLRFTTDGSVTRPGFEFTWQCSDDVNNVVLGAQAQQGCPATYLFEAFNGLPTYNYTWDFGDGFTTTGPGEHEHTYPATGSYTVTLVVDNDGDTNTLTQTVQVQGLNLPLGIIGPDTVEINTNATFEKDGTDLLDSFSWTTGDPATVMSGTGETFTTSWTQIGTYELRLDAGSTEVCAAATIKEVVVVMSVNTTDAEAVEALTLFPNPVGQTLYFDLETAATTELHYEVVDAFGRRLMSNRLEQLPASGPVGIEVGQLPAATYVLVLLDEKGQRLASRRFVKQ